MIRVSVLYPHKDGYKFDHDYYANNHLPMVREKLGGSIVDAGIDRGIGTAAPGAPAPFVSIGWLTFKTMEEFGAAFGPNADEDTAPHGNAIRMTAAPKEHAIGCAVHLDGHGPGRIRGLDPALEEERLAKKIAYEFVRRLFIKQMWAALLLHYAGLHQCKLE